MDKALRGVILQWSGYMMFTWSLCSNCFTMLAKFVFAESEVHPDLSSCSHLKLLIESLICEIRYLNNLSLEFDSWLPYFQPFYTNQTANISLRRIQCHWYTFFKIGSYLYICDLFTSSQQLHWYHSGIIDPFKTKHVYTTQSRASFQQFVGLWSNCP